MNSGKNNDSDRLLRILIVDDSLVFRRFLADIFSERENIRIIGEAQNGIEALDMMLKLKPDVILLDMEMPLMDGMTALQHLMIHRPTPVIMFSSLSEEGTARCFDTLKNGAVDFLCKDFIFEPANLKNRKALIVSKVEKAGRMLIKPRDPVLASGMPDSYHKEPVQQVIFCEDCGSQQAFTVDPMNPVRSITCSNCGDTIDISVVTQDQHKRNNFLTLFIGGYGAYYNLLEIVPKLKIDMGGTIIAVISGEAAHINNFAEYLDAISPLKVVRADEGTHIEGGGCYILSTDDCMSLKQVSTHLTLQKEVIKGSAENPIDVLLASVSTQFKKRTAVVVLSGEEEPVEKGLAIVLKNGGQLQSLSAEECYCTNLGESVRAKLKFQKSDTIHEIRETTIQNHS